MRTSTSRSILVALSVALSSACGNTEPAPIALDDYASESATVTCRRIWECCDAESRMRLFSSPSTPAPSSEAECVTRLMAGTETAIAPLELAVSDGTAEYDAAQAARCVDGVERASCDDFAAMVGTFDPQSECSHIFRGLVPDGESCSSSAECESRFCEASGTCRAQVGEGEPCADAMCELGTFCDPASDPPVCAAMREDGATCSSSLECLSLACDEGTCGRREPLCILE